jgi:hypothetical protein
MNHHDFFNEVLPQVGGAPVHMIDDGSAHCGCPGSDLHTTLTAPAHTTAYWNGGWPWIHCFHSSCRDAVWAANSQLRIISPNVRTRHLYVPVSHRPLNPYPELRALARQNKDEVIERYRWERWMMLAESPFRIPPQPEIQTLLHLSLFEPDDIIWSGQLNYTGKPWSVKNFRPRDNWVDRLAQLGPFVCPAVFKPGTWSRSDANVVARRYLVVESDTLSKYHVGSIFRMLSINLTLRAIVDTGGKSLHGWFDYPDAVTVEQLKVILPELECDPKMFGASQPARLAGQYRDNGNLQQLVYLDPEVSDEN